jgi:glutaredoxin
MSPPDLALLTRDRCHLCDEMRNVLDDVLPALGHAYREIDVDSDPELVARFGESVPVLLRDGRPVAKIRLSRRQLERIVRRRRWWP